MTAANYAIDMERILPARPETVFEALTDPTLFAQWMGPAGSFVVIEEMDPRPGGNLSFRVTLPSDGPTFHLSGTYVEVNPGRVVHTWLSPGDETPSTVTFELSPEADGTRLRILHTGLTSAEDQQQNTMGWEHQLDRLVEALGRLS